MTDMAKLTPCAISLLDLLLRRDTRKMNPAEV